MRGIYKKGGPGQQARQKKKKSLYEKGCCPLLSITIRGKCDETVVKK